MDYGAIRFIPYIFLDEKVQETFIKFANDTKLDKIINILEDKT